MTHLPRLCHDWGTEPQALSHSQRIGLAGLPPEQAVGGAQCGDIKLHRGVHKAGGSGGQLLRFSSTELAQCCRCGGWMRGLGKLGMCLAEFVGSGLLAVAELL
jgi:hypothetical protein